MHNARSLLFPNMAKNTQQQQPSGGSLKFMVRIQKMHVAGIICDT